jgi:hypothetical protein
MTETSTMAMAVINCARWKETGSVRPILDATISKTLLRKKVWLRSFAGTGRSRQLTGSNAMIKIESVETGAVIFARLKRGGLALEPTAKK